MNVIQLTIPGIGSWLELYISHYEAICTNISIVTNQNNIEPNLSEYYQTVAANKEYYLQIMQNFDYGVQESINLFIEGWPLLIYLESIKHICHCQEINKDIKKFLSANQYEKLQKKMLQLNNQLPRQEILLQIFQGQQYFSTKMTQQWNYTQETIFLAAVDILELYSYFYLKTQDYRVKKVLEDPKKAKQWLQYITSENSNLFKDSFTNNSKDKATNHIFFWSKLAAFIATVACITFIVLGNKAHRETYIIFMFISIVALASVFYFQTKNKQKYKTQLDEAKVWLAANATECNKYSPNLMILDGQEPLADSTHLLL